MGYNYSDVINRGDPAEAMRMQTTTTMTTDSTNSTATPQDGTDGPPRRRVRNFVRHYVEMLVAMFLGMFVLGFALEALLELAGVDASSWDTEKPALFLLVMAVNMTVPMVAWMRYRGHRWQLCWEMSAAMFVPTFVAIGVLWAGSGGESHGPMMIQHIGMFPSMLLAMLLRRDEYSRH